LKAKRLRNEKETLSADDIEHYQKIVVALMADALSSSTNA
jgi:hypothetical protein